MAVLRVTLAPEAVGKFHDSLVCLGKFSESVSIEATRDRLTLTALNSTKSAYASFSFFANTFFTRYFYSSPRIQGQTSKEKFSCRIHSKALLPIFKGRTGDPSRERDTSIERCDIIVEDGPEETKSRFIVKMSCINGVLKSYRLTFESVAPIHALFKPELVRNRWGISSKTLRDFGEHFAPKTEQLDICAEGGRANFVSYTEKIIAGNDVLKQPLHTSIAIDTKEFSEFSVDEKLHIVISVKDFKAIMAHAGISNTIVSAAYSYPLSPMLLKYDDGGMKSEFILMTTGDFRGISTTPGPGAESRTTTRPASRQPLEATPTRNSGNETSSMQPPPRSAVPSIAREMAKPRAQRPSSPVSHPSLQSNSLFITEEEDDTRWDPEDEEEEEKLGWDANADNDTFTPTLNYSLQGSNSQNQSAHDLTNFAGEGSVRLEPTQRISQIRGLFDD